MSKKDPLHAHLAYMYGLERFGIRMGLEGMQALMEALGHPERQFASVHITGTNGKGSTAAFLDSMLRQGDLKVGLYTSPHLVTFHERIRINGLNISDEELIDLIEEVREKTAALNPTFFEFTTALAFLHFAQQKVDVAVVEVGMGGNMDATNVVTPLLSIITNIGNDHIPALGRNQDEIARVKAGIIKPGVPLVTAETNPKYLSYFQEVCASHGSQLHVVQDELPVSIRHASLERQTFSTSRAIESSFSIPLLGTHQVANAATALLAAHLLGGKGMNLSLAAMQQGLQATVWPGRLDIVSRHPFILVDGAHNDDGVKALHQFLQAADLPRFKVLVLAVKKGKDITEVVRRIVPLFEEIIITQGTFEPEETGIVAEQVRTAHQHVQECANASDAITLGKKMLGDNDMMLVTGSLYMIGAALPA
jgi:dihydrofolate synthase/folylpolyglutamate synthase